MVNKLALGTVQFGLKYGISNQSGRTQKEEVSKILGTCRSNNIQMLDTASGYGDAEKVLGEEGVSDFQLISKFLPNSDSLAFKNQFSNSLGLLDVNSLYAYLAHRPAELLNKAWEWELMQEEKNKGKIRKVGFSLNKPSEFLDLLEKDMIPDIIQIPYNYLDRRFEFLFEDMKSRSIEIHARSAFMQGLFFMDTDLLSSFFDPIKNILVDIKKSVPNLSGELISFVINNPSIDYLVLGVESENQLVQNIDALKSANKLLRENQDALKVDEDILMPSNWPKS